MNTPTKFISTLMLVLLAAGNATAQTKANEHKGHHPQAAATASAPAMPAASSAGMHDRMEMHCKEMKKINETKDPAKRKTLMEEHMKSMHEDMDMCDMKPGSMGMSAPMPGAAASK